METKQNEVMQAMADAQQSGISTMLVGTTHQAAMAVVVGAAVGTSLIAETREGLMDRANVAALKLQGILKASKAGEARSSHQCWSLPDENDAPIVSVCASVRAAQIGGTSMGMYSGLSATELDW